MLNASPFRGSKGSDGRQAYHLIQAVTMPRILLFILLSFASIQGCDAPVELYNAAPRVTWVQVEPTSEGVAEITVWVFDVEGDPVDLDATWATPGGDQAALAMAPGGHGLVGLSTRGRQLDETGKFTADGQPHLLLWDHAAAGLPATATVELHFTPSDKDDELGVSGTSPSFTLSDGLPEVTRLGPGGI